MTLYCTYNPGSGEECWFRSLRKAVECAEVMVEVYREDCHIEGWCESVEDIIVLECEKKVEYPWTVGRVVATTVRVNIRTRPNDLGPDNCDDQGFFWEHGVDMLCDYAVKEVALQ